MNKQIIAVILSSTAVVSASATVIQEWTFESSTLPGSGTTVQAGTLAGSVYGLGAGASGVHTSASTAWTSPLGNGSDHSWSATRWAVGDYFEFSLSTSGYGGISLQWDQTSSGTGPRDFKLAFSTDGTIFSDLNAFTVLEQSSANGGTWSASTIRPSYTLTLDLSGISDLDDASDLYFRLINTSTVSSSGGTVGTAGASRIDNFRVSGTELQATPVPEPLPFSCAAATFFAMVVLGRRFRANR